MCCSLFVYNTAGLVVNASSNMKAFIVVVITCFVAVARGQEDDFKKMMKDCGESAGFADKESFVKAIKENGINDEKYQKFSECILKNTGTLKDDGSLDFSKWKAKCEASGKDCSFIDECAKQKEDTNSKTYASIVLCGFKHMHKQRKENA
ncbi:uncharacterized protein LOC116179632 [Photinus pyralis]|uniref:uncharacterized protein LOC116179632 n=1 Tax=Photinus pyralis TaxID=7054 RepID=UPI0012673E29|nr:uncharacterized protein LOC116179632 [Photinus pyralis]